MLDLTRHEVRKRLTLWEWIDDDALVLTVGSGPLDEYRIWRRQGDTAWTLTMAGALSQGVLTYSDVADAQRDAVRDLSSVLWADLTP